MKNLWGCFSVVAREGRQPACKTLAAFYCKSAPAHLPEADAAAVRRGHEKIWRCNKTQWTQF